MYQVLTCRLPTHQPIHRDCKRGISSNALRSGAWGTYLRSGKQSGHERPPRRKVPQLPCAWRGAAEGQWRRGTARRLDGSRGPRGGSGARGGRRDRSSGPERGGGGAARTNISTLRSGEPPGWNWRRVRISGTSALGLGDAGETTEGAGGGGGVARVVHGEGLGCW